jgi:hypothetical protein
MQALIWAQNINRKLSYQQFETARFVTYQVKFFTNFTSVF